MLISYVLPGAECPSAARTAFNPLDHCLPPHTRATTEFSPAACEDDRERGGILYNPKAIRLT